jgi:hypothetical protein
MPRSDLGRGVVEEKVIYLFLCSGLTWPNGEYLGGNMLAT